MYRQFMQLSDYPFRLTADARYFFLGGDHLRAKSYLLYSLHVRDGLAVVTGEPGVGKTLVIEQAIKALQAETAVARIRQPRLMVTEFLFAICQQFDCLPQHLNKAALIQAIYDFATERHFEQKSVIVIVDEAHLLSADVLEEIRMLANYEQHGRKIIQIMLVGQPALNSMLSSRNRDSLSQMVRLSCHINPLSIYEVKKYIHYRLLVADSKRSIIFPDQLLPGIMCYTGGVPRLVNILCDMMLIAAYVKKQTQVDASCLHAAVKKLDWPFYLQRVSASPRLMSVQSFSQRLMPARRYPVLKIYRQGRVVGERVLDKERMLIGRKAGVDIRINDENTSKVHAQIVNVDGEYILQDLNSTNGTRVGDEKIHWHYLKEHDRVHISGFVFEFLLEAKQKLRPPQAGAKTTTPAETTIKTLSLPDVAGSN
ncbi:MAG: AAA family ATPase [Gammaproteobacteria bacterium]